MDTIPKSNEGDLDLRTLQVFDVLLTERSLTRAARVLDVTQPALSKTLARLRLYFGDPLFVRVALRMEPTPKALELAEPVRGILERMRSLRSEHAPFDPATSRRNFKFFVIDAGVVTMLPPLIELRNRGAPHVGLQAVQCDAQHLDLWLESGLVDCAVGPFPGLMQNIRRRPLWVERYVSVVRAGHPRGDRLAQREAFLAEQHALVSAVGTGHDYIAVERLLEAAVPPENIACWVPTFGGAALIARQSDCIATLPRTLAQSLAGLLDLRIVEPPIALPEVEIALYWHDRYHREPGNQWIRSVFQDVFSRPAAAGA